LKNSLEVGFRIMSSRTTCRSRTGIRVGWIRVSGASDSECRLKKLTIRRCQKRSLLIGYFEGIDSERGIAWRLADSLALRQFVRIGITEQTPDHSTISWTRRLIDLETHRAVFSWVLGSLADRGLIQGKRVGVDATTLEASAAMRSIVRRDTGESYEEFLTGLARASGMATPTREDLARLDRKRKKRTSNQEWMSPTDSDARVTKMKDGRTHLAHKAEHAVDLDTGAGGGGDPAGSRQSRHDHVEACRFASEERSVLSHPEWGAGR
jgi:hypothetical protein